MPRVFSDVVDWSTILIDLWRRLDGPCPSWVRLHDGLGDQDGQRVGSLVQGRRGPCRPS